MWKKLNSLIEDDTWYFMILLCAVSVASFILGSYSAQEGNVSTKNQAAVVVHEVPAGKVEAEEGESAESNGIAVVVSKNGTKYHLPTCPGAKQISDKNKISFPSFEAAEAAGYTKAANCKF